MKVLGLKSGNVKGSSLNIREIRRVFVRCFSSTDGKKVLELLKSMSSSTYLSPSASDAELRHLQGQRYIIDMIVKYSDKTRF